MGLWSNLLQRWRRPVSIQRAGPPINTVPQSGAYFGPGITSQAPHDVLLQESIGIPDAACRAIANRVSSLDLEVYTEHRIEPGTVEDEILDDHPLDKLLERPHPNLTQSQLLRLTAQYIVT